MKRIGTSMGISAKHMQINNNTKILENHCKICVTSSTSKETHNNYHGGDIKTHNKKASYAYLGRKPTNTVGTHMTTRQINLSHSKS